MESGVRSVTGLLLAALALAACQSMSPQPPKAMEPIEGELEVSATVEKIDVPKRLLSLKTESGEVVTIEVDPAVQNLSQVKVGDRVVAKYRQSIGAMIASSGGQPVTVDADSQTAKPGEKPSASTSTTTNIPVTIASVDTKTNTVNFYGPDGQARTLTVETPQAKEFIKQLKPGDNVVVTYSEAVALSVEPAQ